MIGSMVDGKYRIDRLLGVGGMGKVYGGTNVRTESPVAIKTLIPDLVRDESLVLRFEIEAKAASNLRHPNTIRIYDFGKEGDTFFMVMELLDGISLEGLVRREKRIDPSRAIRIMRQVCSSLTEAHASGLVHRDLKPDNIFLNSVGAEDDFVKVLDFGVAKLRDKRYGNATLTQAGMIFGTPRYMSPEQARAQDIDGRSDIYALGVILFECLTGAVPFDANDPVAVLVKHVNEPPPSFADVAQNLPDMNLLEGVVMRCLAKDPADRYPSVEVLRAELEIIESRLARGATDPAGQPQIETLAMPTGLEATAPNPKGARGPATGDGFSALGVDGAGSRDPTYAIGDGTLGLDTARKRSPLPLVVGGVVAVLVVAAVLIATLLRGSGPTEPIAEAPSVEPPTGPPEPEAPAPVDIGPAVLAAGAQLDAAVGAAVAVGPGRVVRLVLESADDAVVTAALDTEANTAAVASNSPEQAELPATWLFVRNTDAPDEAMAFVFSAEGRLDMHAAFPVAEFDGNPVSVELQARPRSNNGSGRDNGGTVQGGRDNPWDR